VRAAVDELERAVAAPSGDADQWYGPLGVGLEHLYDAFGHHVEVTDGLFAEVAAQTPRLATRVARLRDDHLAIRAAIRDALGDLQTPTRPDVAGVADARQHVLRVLALVAHHCRGDDLFYEAYYVGTEGGG
jgi:hypothetical protein